MTDEEPNIGERAAQAKKSRFNRMLIVMAGFGLMLGAMLRYVEADRGAIYTATPESMAINPAIAILVAIAVVVILIALPASGLKSMDELQRKNNINATAIAGLAAITAFPVWHLLYLGELLPPPTALGMFIILLGSGFAAYVFLSWRNR